MICFYCDTIISLIYFDITLLGSQNVWVTDSVPLLNRWYLKLVVEISLFLESLSMECSLTWRIKRKDVLENKGEVEITHFCCLCIVFSKTVLLWPTHGTPCYFQILTLCFVFFFREFWYGSQSFLCFKLLLNHYGCALEHIFWLESPICFCVCVRKTSYLYITLCQLIQSSCIVTTSRLPLIVYLNTY